MANFPSVSPYTEDASLLEIEREDNALRAPTDGGYEFVRPRFTRRQRRLITSGFTALPHAYFLTVDAFYNTYETTQAFTYTLPTTGEVLTVRFAEPIKHSHKGFGHTYLWDVRFKLKEV